MGNLSPYWDGRLPISGDEIRGRYEAHPKGTLRTAGVTRSVLTQYDLGSQNAVGRKLWCDINGEEYRALLIVFWKGPRTAWPTRRPPRLSAPGAKHSRCHGERTRGVLPNSRPRTWHSR
jgi:hypothetical protein